MGLLIIEWSLLACGGVDAVVIECAVAVWCWCVSVLVRVGMYVCAVNMYAGAFKSAADFGLV